MEYIVAQYRIRTTGRFSDIAAVGVRGFAPFVVEDEPTAEAVMELNSECDIDKEQFGTLTEISRFGFEEDLAECILYRYSGGFLFEMIKGEEHHLFAKSDDSPIVNSNYGLFEKVDISLLRFGLWIMFGIAIVPLGAIAIHSSVLVKNEGAVLCLGESGTGKSTHTRLWREHIEGTTLLNDDSPIIRMVDGIPTAFGSPWSGKTPCYRNLNYPIRTISHLFKKTTIRGTFTCLARRTCSLVWGIGPSVAATTRIAPSICAAPVTIFLT